MTDDGEIILQLGLVEGRNADAAVAAESLLAWIDLARDAARAIDPQANVRVELLGREKGSLRQVLRLVDDQLQTVSDGADEFPYLKKAAIGLAIGIATAGLPVFIEKSLEAPAPPVVLSARDRALFSNMTNALRENVEVARSAKRFYRALERDPAITNVEVRDGHRAAPLVTVDRAEFALRGGLYSPDTEPNPEQVMQETWSVVLMHAPFYATTRHWGFSRDGVKFSAQMTDLEFLQAIVEKTAPISLHEGVRMEVLVEWRERLEGKTWHYIPDTRRIVRVLSPRPAGSTLSTDHPEEGNQPEEDAG